MHKNNYLRITDLNKCFFSTTWNQSFQYFFLYLSCNISCCYALEDLNIYLLFCVWYETNDKSTFFCIIYKYTTAVECIRIKLTYDFYILVYNSGGFTHIATGPQKTTYYFYYLGNVRSSEGLGSPVRIELNRNSPLQDLCLYQGLEKEVFLIFLTYGGGRFSYFYTLRGGGGSNTVAAYNTILCGAILT